MSAVEGPGGEGPGSSGRRYSHDEEGGWVVLRRKVEIVGQEALIGGEAAVLDLAPPPTASILVVSRSILPHPSRFRSSGFVECCDNTGFVLFSVTRGATAARKYFVFDARNCSVAILPDIPASLLQPGSSDRMGVMADPGRGSSFDFFVTQLQITGQNLRPRLLVFDSKPKCWRIKEIIVAPLDSDQAGRIQPHIVISHRDRLVFADLKHGLLMVDPSTDGAAARFVALPPLPAAEFASDQIGRTRCMMPCNGNLFFFCLDELSETPTVCAWKFVDVDGREEQTSPWDTVYMHSVDIWPVLTRNLSSAGIGLVDPHCATLMYLFAGEMLVGIDLHTGNLLQSQLFFPEIGSGAHSYSSTDVWAWTPPPRASSSITARKKAMKNLRKTLKKMGKYLMEHPDCLITAGMAVEKYAAAYIPAHMGKTRAGAKYLSKALSGAGTAIKWNNLDADWLREVAEVPEVSDRVHDVVTVKTPDQALEVISCWKNLGKPMHGFRVQFSDDLGDNVRAEMSTLFGAHGADNLLHNGGEWDDWELI